MIEDQPALLQLRWLQAISQSSGNTVVVGGDAPAALGRPKQTGNPNRPSEGNDRA